MTVEAGLVAFTEVPAGAHLAYNEWHQLDHLPEVHTLAGVARGERWVASPRCRATSAASPPFDAAQYFTLYLLAAPVGATLDGIARLSAELEAAGRSFAERRTVFSSVLPLAGAAAAASAGVSPRAVPFRPATGVHVLVDQPGGPVPPELTGIEGVAGSWTFASDDHRVTVSWLDDEPAAAAPRLAALVDGHPASHAGVYEAIRPGHWDWFER